MRYLSSSTQAFAVTAAVMATAAFLNACTGWYTATLEPRRFTSEKSPQEVRVTLSDSTRFEVHHPVVVGDSLVWIGQRSPGEASRQAIALGTIRSVQVHRTDATLTALLVVGLVSLSAIGFQCSGPWSSGC